MAFVSLTNQSKETTAVFVQGLSLPWPSGYGADLDLLARFGAADLTRMNLPGYEVIPTIYLIGPDGLIRWSDRRARFRHVEKEVIVKDLESSILRTLDGDPMSKAKQAAPGDR